MNGEQVRNLGKEVSSALAALAAVAEERDFLRRVLKQALLTHGGELRIDIAHSDAAKNDKRELEICGGGVRLVGMAPHGSYAKGEAQPPAK